MKRSILFSFLLVLLTSNVFASTTEVLLFINPTLPGPKPHSLTFIPVSATISETELSVYFESSVGDAIITVYDASNEVVYQQTVDTDSTREVYIPSGTWVSGNYTITVSYGTTDLIGEFQME